MRMSTHEDDDQDQDQEINVDSDSRLSCGTNSDVDMDGGGSCYDSETALGLVDNLNIRLSSVRRAYTNSRSE